MATSKKKTSATDEIEAPQVNPAIAFNAGLSAEDVAAINTSHKVAAAETAVEDTAVPESKRLFILQEIRTSPFTVVRRRVELTPSMCRHRGCGFDAAKEAGYPGGWATIPHDQLLPSGRTLADAVLGILESHAMTRHTIEQDHIMTEDQVKRGKQWAGVSGSFLTNPTA